MEPAFCQTLRARFPVCVAVPERPIPRLRCSLVGAGHRNSPANEKAGRGGGKGRWSVSEFGGGVDLDEMVGLEQRLHAVQGCRGGGHVLAEHFADAGEQGLGHT